MSMKTCKKCKTLKSVFDFSEGSKVCLKCEPILEPIQEFDSFKDYLQLSWEGIALKILQAMKNNSKGHGRKWDDSWWTVDKIVDRIKNKKCEVTGFPFELTEIKQKGKKRPFIPSPDRIDNNKPYHPDNVQFVVFMYNMMKSNFDNEDVARFLRIISMEDTKKSNL